MEDSLTYPYSVEQLIKAAERVMSSDPKLFSYAREESPKEINIRLIRDYVVREIIPRPLRAGRESRFGAIHLIQLLAVRRLLRSEKWSLPAIRAYLGTTSTDEILNTVLAPARPLIERELRKAEPPDDPEAARPGAAPEAPEVPLNPAQLLIRRFQQANRPESGSVAAPAVAAPAVTAGPPREGQAFSARLHFGLGPGCEFVVDAARLPSLTPEEIEAIAETLKSRLMKETAH
ncbi:MAG: hypothetical protein LBS31_07980 [Candidatus Adiutrix sp.]|nr:hypothetical protein [Candidatus Adiutrix sp.]